jgi:hypothetical protein
VPEAFSYALLRVVPSISRGEAVNVGVILHCRRRDFLGVAIDLDGERLRALDPAIDLAAVGSHLAAIERIAAGDEGAGPIAALERSERFGALVTPASTIVQASPVHTGVTDDPAATLERLRAELVAPPAAP